MIIIYRKLITIGRRTRPLFRSCHDTYIYYNETVVCVCVRRRQQLPNCNLFRNDGTQPPVNNLNVNLLINDTNCFSKLSFMDFSIRTRRYHFCRSYNTELDLKVDFN